MSSFVCGHSKQVGASAKAAQISRRWVWDLDGIAVTHPESLPGKTVKSILKTFFNKEFQFAYVCRENIATANCGWNDQIDRSAGTLFV